MCSYLENRQQCVQIGNCQSKFQTVEYGVPQGSVLGPLLFLLYINDISKSSNILDFHLFADDTSLFHSHTNINELQTSFNNELNKVAEWLTANKLSLNVKKTNVLLFRNKNESNLDKIELKINNELLEEKVFAKYLGIIFDNKLTWENQINHINTKLTISNAFLVKLRYYVDKKILNNLYNAFVQPHLDYANTAWGNCAQKHLGKIISTQNRIMRMINFKTKRDPTYPLYKSKNILPLKENIMYSKGKFIWKLTHDCQPRSVKDLFSSHGASLCNRDIDKQFLKLKLPFQRTEKGLDFIIYSGVKLWNQKIPNNIKIRTTFQLFKKEFKSYLIENVQE